MNYENLVKPSLLEMPTFRRAFNMKEIMEKYGLTSVIKMAANENQVGPSKKAVLAMKQEAERAYLYPDKQADLVEAIASKYGVKPENVMLNNGATGVINSIGETFIMPGDEVIMSSIPYQQYPIMVRRNEGVTILVPVKEDLSHDLEAMLAAITDKTKLIMICNPGNPTSVAENPSVLESFLTRVPKNVLVMIDEAYLDFATTPGYKKSQITNITKIPNLMIVRTFSKLYALAGLRVGFVISSADVISCLTRGGTVINVNRIGMAAAIASLEDTEYEIKSYEANKEGKEYLTKKLLSYGWYVYPSDTNFLYFDTDGYNDSLMEELLKRGIIIRKFTLNRISIGSKRQNEALAAMLDEIVTNGVPKIMACC